MGFYWLWRSEGLYWFKLRAFFEAIVVNAEVLCFLWNPCWCKVDGKREDKWSLISLSYSWNVVVLRFVWNPCIRKVVDNWERKWAWKGNCPRAKLHSYFPKLKCYKKTNFCWREVTGEKNSLIWNFTDKLQAVVSIPRSPGIFTIETSMKAIDLEILVIRE